MMGKPSSTQIPRRSNHSITLNRIKRTVSTPKMDITKRKRRNRTKRNIHKLFNALRNESVTSIANSSQDTVIALDSSSNETINSKNQTVIHQRKRKSPITFSPKSKKFKNNNNNQSLIVINDDLSRNDSSIQILSPKNQSSHINCSTPITKRDSGSIKRMIINNFCEPSSSTSKTQPKPNNELEIVNLDSDTTKVINGDSYLTIDLTTDSDNRTVKNNVKLENTKDSQDCTLISVSEDTLSQSADSDVTIIENYRSNDPVKDIQNFKSGISKLSSSEKGKLLMLITKKILNGCNMSDDIKEALNNSVKAKVSRSVETAEDTYIREVILGETEQGMRKKSNSSIGSNIYHPSVQTKRTGLRMIVIDGSNVAMEHTKGKQFSVKGLKICIDYFVRRGHVVKAFVPRFRCKYGKSTDPRLLDSLERQGLVVYTPSREIKGRMFTSYDDRYIVQCAAEFDAVIVSGDNYRDLLQENPRWRHVIENRLLQFTWVDDMIMFPRDPMGKGGVSLEKFLKHDEPTVLSLL